MNKINNKKDATNVALIVIHKVLTKLNSHNSNKYLNISINRDYAEEASVALMVMRQPHELGPNRLPGFPRRDDLFEASIPARGASVLNFSKMAEVGR